MIELVFIWGFKSRIAWLRDAPLRPGGFNKMPIGVLLPALSALTLSPHPDETDDLSLWRPSQTQA